MKSGTKPGLGHAEKRQGIALLVIGGLYVCAWLDLWVATRIAGGNVSQGFLQIVNPFDGGVWHDARGNASPWRLLGAADTLSRVAFWAILMLLPSLLAAVPFALRFKLIGYPTWLIMARKRLRRAPLMPKSTRFAEPTDLAELLVKQPQPGRIIFGDYGKGRFLAAPWRMAMLILAPTGGGKTAGQLIPSIQDWDGPLIAVTTKDDIWEYSAGVRQGKGPLHLYDVLAKTRWRDMRMHWNPLDGCDNYQSAVRMASTFAESATGGAADGGVSDGQFWQQTGKRLLTCAFYAAACQKLTLEDVRRWVDNQDLLAIKKALLYTQEGWRPKTGNELTREGLVWPPEGWDRSKPVPEEYLVTGRAYDNFNSMTKLPDNTRQSIFITAATLLQALLYKAAVDCSVATTFDVDAFLDDPNASLYMVSPPGEHEDLVPFICGLIMFVIRRVRDRDLAGVHLQKPLLVVLDEAANIAPLAELGSIVTQDRSRGVVTVVALQSLAQGYEVWGQNGFNTILGNLPAKVFLGGIHDRPTLEYASDLLGREQVTDVTRSFSDGGGSTSEVQRDQELMKPDQVRQIPEGKGVAVVSRMRPIYFNQRLYFRDPRLKELARIRPLTGASRIMPGSGGEDWKGPGDPPKAPQSPESDAQDGHGPARRP